MKFLYVPIKARLNFLVAVSSKFTEINVACAATSWSRQRAFGTHDFIVECALAKEAQGYRKRHLRIGMAKDRKTLARKPHFVCYYYQ